MTKKAKQTEEEPYRINLTLNPETKAELETLKHTTQKSSLVDVFRAALAVYKIISEHQQSGGKVIFQSKDGSSETVRFIP